MTNRAVQAARHYLSFFQGRCIDGHAPTSACCARVPENRLRVYDTRRHGRTWWTTAACWCCAPALAPASTPRWPHRRPPVGLLANNPAPGRRHRRRCGRQGRALHAAVQCHGLPIVSLVDTPGFMVGPEVEATAQVRHVSRLFVTAASLRVPFFSVVLRKGYGLGAMGMTAGGFMRRCSPSPGPRASSAPWGWKAPCAWVSEGAGGPPEGAERDALFANLLAKSYANGEAMHMAATLEIDAVIDPADTRAWLARGLASARWRRSGTGSSTPQAQMRLTKRPFAFSGRRLFVLPATHRARTVC